MTHTTVRRLLVVAVVVVAGLLAAPGAAHAHPTLLYTTPTADTAETQSPTSVVLVFNEPVTPAAGGLVVLDQAGRQTEIGQVTAERGGTVTGHLPATLPTGVYTLRWRVTGADGDLMESTFRFAVGAAITSADTTTATGRPTGTSWPSVGWRWLLFAGLALALGGAVGTRLSTSARTLRPNLPALRGPASAAGAALGLAGTAGLMASLLITSGADALISATAGRVALIEATAFAACLALLRVRPGWAWLPLLAVPAAEGFRGHPQQAQPGWGALLIAVHLAAAAVWIGALLHAVRVAVAWRGHRPAILWVLSGYARWAGWLLATVLATGTVSALLVAPLSTLTTTTYGRWLLAKLALVTVSVTAAAFARWWLRRQQPTLPRIAAATRVESVTLVGVLAVTAVLVSTPPRQSTPLAPPDPTGTVVPLGTLAGQIGVAVAASEGQLVVRLSTPTRGDYYAPAQARPAFTLTGRLAPAEQPEQTIRWRPCGEGCFLAAVTWARGDNLLTLRTAADHWHGGTVSLAIPWPVQPAADELARTVAAMTTAGPMTVYEAITSDTSTPMPEPTPLSLTAAQFVATEPYSAGVATQAVMLSRGSGVTRLAIGFPAEGRYAELTLDGHSRIEQEILVDAKHLTRRRFVYNEPA